MVRRLVARDLYVHLKAQRYIRIILLLITLEIEIGYLDSL